MSGKDPMRFAVGPHVSGGIGIQFLQPVSWMVLSKEEAIRMAFLLLDHAGVKYASNTETVRLMMEAGRFHGKLMEGT